MNQVSYELFKSANIEKILTVIKEELATRNESPFWTDKVVPFSEAILSVLIPLRDTGKLFTPENKPVDELTPELFLTWSDFVSLKSLAFKIQKSDEFDIDLELLGSYLSTYTVNLEDENLDFPISSYNLHQEIGRAHV